MRERYPHLFTDSGTPFRPCFPSCDRSGTNDGYIGIYCNDLFSRFVQQTSILEKLAEAMDPRRTVMGTTDRRRVSFQNT